VLFVEEGKNGTTPMWLPTGCHVTEKQLVSPATSNKWKTCGAM
jgi:hypothetical protein